MKNPRLPRSVGRSPVVELVEGRTLLAGAALTLPAELASKAGGTYTSQAHRGYNGSGFSDFGGNASSATFNTAAASGAATISFRYANGSGASRPTTVSVNGKSVGTVAFAPTGGWDVWKTAILSNILLPTGNAAIKLTASTSTGGPNLDELTIDAAGGSTPSSQPTPTPSPTPAPTPGPATGVSGGIGAVAGGTTFAPAIADGNAARPTPVITARQTTIKAGQAVFVSGLSSTLNGGDATTARYEWDFGDGSAKYNKLIGFSAGHVYAKAGTYTVTLRVLNANRGAASVTKTITVQPAARRQIFVSAAGSDGNDGSADRPIKSIARAAALISKQSNVEVLLRRGDRFDQSTSLVVGGANVRIAAYGSGADPILRWNGAKTQQNMVLIVDAASGAMVEDITFDSIWPGPNADRTGLPYAIKVDGNDSVVRGSTFLNVSYALQTNGKPTGLLVQDNDAPSAFALRSYFLWGEGSDFVVLGNRVANVIHEHSIRIFGVTRMLLAYNDLANPKTYSFEPSKNSLNLQWADYAYVYGNTIHGNYQLGPLGGTDGLEWKQARLDHLVFEANHGIDATMRIVPGLQNSVIRNNVLEKKDENAIIIDPKEAAYDRTVTNITFADNTVINPGTKGKFLYVGGRANRLSVINNLYKADNLIVGENVTAGIYVNDTSLASFRQISGNVWPVPTIPTWAKGRIPGGTGINAISLDPNAMGNYYNIDRWNGLAGVGSDGQQDTSVGANFAPSTSSTAARFDAKYPGVFSDYSGKARPITGAWTAGAVQV